MTSEQPQDKYVLRLPEGMRADLKAAATANNRSMNAEIIARISRSQFALRDWFAGLAMAALVGREDAASSRVADLIGTTATVAYRLADAMLAEQERSK